MISTLCDYLPACERPAVAKPACDRCGKAPDKYGLFNVGEQKVCAPCLEGKHV